MKGDHMARDIVAEMHARVTRDAERFALLDPERCMLCGAQGPDKRSLYLDCFYAIHEVLPEAIDLTRCGVEAHERGYYLLICKACRGRLLATLAMWRAECLAMRGQPLDSDGTLEEPDKDIPVRILGATVMMSDDEWRAYRDAQGLPYVEPRRVRSEEDGR